MKTNTPPYAETQVRISQLKLGVDWQMMELLWRSMSAEPAKLESPAWYKKDSHQRLARVEAGKGDFLTLAQLNKRLAKRAA